MSAKTYLRILQVGIIASLSIVLFVFSDLLFPYITSKQIPFNILMEILLVFWVVFIVRFPQYRPKRSYIGVGLIAYFLAILASCVVSVDFNLSFWGDTERLLGFFHLLHFLIFYYILITVFRSWWEWKILLLSSVVVATAVSLKGILGPNVYSFIGNVAYVAGYLIFNLFFCAILFVREKKWFRWLYILPVIVMLIEFVATRISGAMIGLVVGGLFFFLLLGFFHERKRVRLIVLGLLLVMVLGIVFVFSQRNSAWFQGNETLNDINLEKGTFQTRLFSWESAWLDFGHHPVFGTGFGNYAITFDRYFNPDMLSHVRTETYFDRAHNNLIDIASTTGSVGLIAYLSIFVFVLYYLWVEFRKNGGKVSLRGKNSDNLEILLIVSLLAAYFIQNLAVFDSFSTYIALMILLGYIGWFRGKNGEKAVVEMEEKKKGSKGEILLFISLLIVVLIFINQFSIKPWKTFSKTILAYGQMMEGDASLSFETFREALKSEGVMDRDARTVLISFSISNSNMFSYLPSEDLLPSLDYVVSLAERNLEYNPQDSLMQMQLAQILEIAARASVPDLELFNMYSAQSLQAIDGSIESSPGRIPVYLVKAQILLGRGEVEESLATISYAINLNTNFPDGYCRFAQVAFLLEMESNLEGALDNCLVLGGAQYINSSYFLKDALTYYANQGEYQQVLDLAQRLVEVDGTNPEVWFNLAKIYIILGNVDQAKILAQKAIELDTRLEPAVIDLFENIGE